MRAALLMGAGLQKLWEVLGNTEVANAEANVEEDRVKIVELVSRAVGGLQSTGCARSRA